MDVTNITGNYDLKVEGKTYEVKIKGEPSSPKTEVKLGETQNRFKDLTYKNNWMNLLLSSPDTTKTEFIRLVAKVPSKTEQISRKGNFTKRK